METRTRGKRKSAGADNPRRPGKVSIPGMPSFGYYEAIVTAWEARQISEDVWEDYLAQDDFAAWYLADTLCH